METTLHKGQFENPALQEFIHRYEVFRFVFCPAITPPVKYHTLRPEQPLMFYPRDFIRATRNGTA